MARHPPRRRRATSRCGMVEAGKNCRFTPVGRVRARPASARRSLTATMMPSPSALQTSVSCPPPRNCSSRNGPTVVPAARTRGATIAVFGLPVLPLYARAHVLHTPRRTLDAGGTAEGGRAGGRRGRRRHGTRRSGGRGSAVASRTTSSSITRRSAGSTRRVEREAGVYRVVDLGSTNGTFVDGAQLRPWQPQPLSHGSTIDFGGVSQVRFLLSETERAGGDAATTRRVAEREVRLTNAEQDVLERLFMHYDDGRPAPRLATLKEVADQRFTSTAAVKMVLQGLYDKFELDGSSERNKETLALRAQQWNVTRTRFLSVAVRGAASAASSPASERPRRRRRSSEQARQRGANARDDGGGAVSERDNAERTRREVVRGAASEASSPASERPRRRRRSSERARQRGANAHDDGGGAVSEREQRGANPSGGGPTGSPIALQNDRLHCFRSGPGTALAHLNRLLPPL